jgi:hypothetical protein
MVLRRHSGIETVQIIAYAARVLQLAQVIIRRAGRGLEPAFLARMAEAKSNEPSAGDGAQIYKACVDTMELGLEQVAAHYAISSVFSSFAEETDLFCYQRAAHLLRHSYTRAGDGWRWAGRTLRAPSPARQQSFSFAVLHFGDQNITAAVKPTPTPMRRSLRPLQKGRGACAARVFP